MYFLFAVQRPVDLNVSAYILFPLLASTLFYEFLKKIKGF